MPDETEWSSSVMLMMLSERYVLQRVCLILPVFGALYIQLIQRKTSLAIGNISLLGVVSLS